jgi:endonuclease YncB( thermonuclease family)
MKKFLNYSLMIIALSAFAAVLYLFNESQPSNNTANCNLEGKVIRVVDGDSITVLDSEKEQHKIRLAGIDAPERKQPFGKLSRQFLAKHIFKKQVCVGWYKRDKYQRLVGVVRFEGEDMNLKLVKAGLAWHYKQYQNEQSKSDRVLYANAHENAEKMNTGLWNERRPVAPWLWRRGER